MSGVIKGIGKLFKAVVIKPVEAIAHAVKEAAVWAWHQPIIRMAAIAVAAYFTAGAAMAYFGAPAAAGASASAVGGTFDAGASALGDSAAASFGTLGTAEALPASLGGITGASSASVLAAGGEGVAGASGLAAFSGQAVGAAAQAAGETASTIAQTTAITSLPAGTSDTAIAQVAQTAGETINTMTPATLAAPQSLDFTGTVGQSAFTGTQAVGTVADATPGLMGTVENGASNLWTVIKNVATDVGHGVENVGAKLFGSSAPVSTAGLAPGTVAPAASGGLLGDMGKAALIQGGLQMASALLTKPQPQMQYAGVNAKGQGAGLGIHTINSGFGLATGGGEPAPSGVPANLKPGAGALTAGAYTGAQLSNAAIAGGQPASAPGNLGQTVANSAGIGGLVPQGAVNYMGTPS